MVRIRWAFTSETIKGPWGETWRAIESRSVQLGIYTVWQRVDDMSSPSKPCGLHDRWGRVQVLDVTHTNIFFHGPVVLRERLENGGHVAVELKGLIALDRHVVDR